MEKKLIVITGATGSGKTFIRDYLVNQYHAAKVITHTTREPREKERDGIDYYFETPESFAKLHLLEQVHYVTAQYGSSQEAIDQAFHHHQLAVIVLDTKGAITYAQKLGSLVDVWFIKVDNPETLRHRMHQRGDNVQRIQQRLASPEFKRDMQVPEKLKSIATVIDNNSWPIAKQQVDNIINH